MVLPPFAARMSSSSIASLLDRLPADAAKSYKPELMQSCVEINSCVCNTIDEVKKDRLYYDKAMEVIRRRPADFAYACFVRVVRFWSIVPNSKERGSRTQTIIGYGSAFWYGLLFLAAITGLSRIAKIYFYCPEIRRSVLRQFTPAVLLVVAFQGLHLLYWSNMRMRAPLVAVIALLAVLSLVKSETLKKIGKDEAEKSKS